MPRPWRHRAAQYVCVCVYVWGKYDMWARLHVRSLSGKIPFVARLFSRRDPVHYSTLQQTATGTKCQVSFKDPYCYRAFSKRDRMFNRAYQSKLLYTATYCNILQHTATHCNRDLTLNWAYQSILKYTLTPRIATTTLQHSAKQCNTVQKLPEIELSLPYTLAPRLTKDYATHCNTLQHTATTTWHWIEPSVSLAPHIAKDCPENVYTQICAHTLTITHTHTHSYTLRHTQVHTTAVRAVANDSTRRCIHT